MSTPTEPPSPTPATPLPQPSLTEPSPTEPPPPSPTEPSPTTALSPPLPQPSWSRLKPTHETKWAFARWKKTRDLDTIMSRNDTIMSLPAQQRSLSNYL